MERLQILKKALTVISVGALFACADTASPPPTDKSATLSISADVSGTGVATVVVDVTASDIPVTLVFNIPVTSGVAAGTLTIPAGANRTITVRAYDAGGVETHTGTMTTTIQPGSNGSLSILLTPLTGSLPITVTLGYYVITVTPPSPGLTVGSTVQLMANIKDSNGNPVSGVVTWATHDPGVATVDNTGLVTGRGAGTTTISAVYQGVSGNASVTVTP